MRIINLLNLNDMDKLIKDIEKIIDDDKCDGIIAMRLYSSLNRYKARRRRAVKSSVNNISSEKLRQIDLLVDYASDFWDMLPHESSCIFTYQDYYRMGYINAVLRIMEIFGIDEKRVKK